VNARAGTWNMGCRLRRRRETEEEKEEEELQCGWLRGGAMGCSSGWELGVVQRALRPCGGNARDLSTVILKNCYQKELVPRGVATFSS
jgi:hypothetical protein